MTIFFKKLYAKKWIDKNLPVLKRKNRNKKFLQKRRLYIRSNKLLVDACRYKKLLCMLDLTKDFFFSYSYHVMRSLQKNTCRNNDNEDALVLYETMFVWNEFLTRGVRNLLQNTMWTVALVYGFFEQVIWLHISFLSLYYWKFIYCKTRTRFQSRGGTLNWLSSQDAHAIMRGLGT